MGRSTFFVLFFIFKFSVQNWILKKDKPIRRFEPGILVQFVGNFVWNMSYSGKSQNDLASYLGLIDDRMSPSDKEQPVFLKLIFMVAQGIFSSFCWCLSLKLPVSIVTTVKTAMIKGIEPLKLGGILGSFWSYVEM